MNSELHMRGYIKSLGIVFMSGLLIVMLINSTVDPEAIYVKSFLREEFSKTYVRLLVRSPNGMIQKGYNERSIKAALATMYNDYECIILGSSRVMSISMTSRTHPECESILNLGVSGGAVEDMAIFSWIMRDAVGKKFFIGVDPWLYGLERDVRYGSRKKLLEYTNDEHSDDFLLSHYSRMWMTNLINLDYFMASLDYISEVNIFEEYHDLLRAYDTVMKDIVPEPVEPMNGSDVPVTLPDGSHVYDREFTRKKHQLTCASYKVYGADAVTEEGVEMFNDIYELLSSRNNVYFLFTPYSPSCFAEDGDTSVSIALTYSATLELSRELGIPVYGSYDPHSLDCQDSDFYDFMHPRRDCVAKAFYTRVEHEEPGAVN